MPTFAELVEMIRNANEENPLPADIADQLTGAYTEDISLRDAAVADRDNRLNDFTSQMEERSREVTRLKAVNYDLLMSAPKPGTEQGGNESTDDDGPRGIASLFEKENR